MADYITKNIRNIVLLGHGSTGKTSLVEAMLYRKKLTDRLGKTTEGNTVCDYDAEEIKRGFTLSAAMVNFIHNDIKINVIDAPGYLGFRGEATQAARVADAAIIVVDGRTGVQVGTDLGWDYATEAGIPKAFFINRFDDPEARFAKAFMCSSPFLTQIARSLHVGTGESGLVFSGGWDCSCLSSCSRGDRPLVELCV